MFSFYCENTDYVQMHVELGQQFKVMYENGFIEHRNYIHLKYDWICDIFPDYKQEAFDIIYTFCKLEKDNYFRVKDSDMAHEAALKINTLWHQQAIIFKLTGQEWYIKNYE